MTRHNTFHRSSGRLLEFDFIFGQSQGYRIEQKSDGWRLQPPKIKLLWKAMWTFAINCSPLTVLLKLLSQMSPNLVGSIYGRSCIKICSFRPDPLTNMAAIGNSSFWLVDFKRSSLKPPGQMNRSLVRRIYGKSLIKIAHYVPIC